MEKLLTILYQSDFDYVVSAINNGRAILKTKGIASLLFKQSDEGIESIDGDDIPAQFDIIIFDEYGDKENIDLFMKSLPQLRKQTTLLLSLDGTRLTRFGFESLGQKFEELPSRISAY